MKLARFGRLGEERPAIVDGRGQLRDASGLVSAGVGVGIKPEPDFLKVGDELRLSIEGLGEQRQRIVPTVGGKGRAQVRAGASKTV